MAKHQLEPERNGATVATLVIICFTLYLNEVNAKPQIEDMQ